MIISYLTKGLEKEKERAWQAPLSLVKRQVRSIICSERADMTSRDGQTLLMLCLLAMLPRAPQFSSLTLIQCFETAIPESHPACILFHQLQEDSRFSYLPKQLVLCFTFLLDWTSRLPLSLPSTSFLKFNGQKPKTTICLLPKNSRSIIHPPHMGYFFCYNEDEERLLRAGGWLDKE